MGKGVSVVFKKLSSVWLVASMAAAGAVLASDAVVSAATTVVVTHDGQQGWHSRVTDPSGTPDPTYGSVTFVNGPGTPPRGVGSLRLMTNPNPGPPYTHGDGSAQMRNTKYGNVLLKDVTALNYYAYHTFVAGSTNQQQWPYLALDVACTGCSNNPPTITNTDRLFFEPPYQAPGTGGLTCAHQALTASDNWQQWDALSGCWWDNGGELGGGGTDTRPLSDFIALHLDARIYNPNGVGGVRLAVGFASPTDQFDGNVDMFTIGVNGNSTSYDFEPPPACQEADGNGNFQSQDGRQGNFQMDNDNCEESGHGGNGESGQGDNVSSSNRGDGTDFHSTNIESTQFDPVAGTTTIAGVGTTNGIPVAFTLVAVQSSIASLGSVSMVFSDGYSITGDLVNGSISLS
jgi:hypothetical protein